ncbi:E3 ubiquitin-protein ligase TRIM71-like [Patiria miniata]|uniref:Uncharacterized protein n=1 Tax=Patiria miniata TaxID=46514 RepID=A0A913ZCH7_PATMI|nr:E3 ubiquitin-protein ligase TRIM71-like [Patiria miniata]
MASSTTETYLSDPDRAVVGKRTDLAQGEKMSRLTRNSSIVSENDELEKDQVDLSLCVLCQKDLQTPKLLPCLHSFCKVCLVKLVQDKDTCGPTSCPLCRDTDSSPFDDVDTLTDNTLLSSLQELKRMKGNHDMDLHPDDLPQCEVKCTSCDRANPATCRCTNCQDFLCDTCTLSHKSLKILQHHELIEINLWRQQNKSFEQNCPKHSGEPISFYCQTCKALVCKDCTDLDHRPPQHNTCSLLEGAVLCRRTVDKLLTLSRQTEAKFKGAWEILTSMKAELMETTKSLRYQVQDAFKKERDVLEEREKEFLSKINVIERQREATVNTHLDRVETVLEKLWTAFDMAEMLMDNGNDFHFLSLEPVVCTRLQSLYKTSPELPNSDLTIIDLTDEQRTDSVEEQNPGPRAEATEKDKMIVWELEKTVGDRGSGKGQFDWCKGVAASLDSHAVVADWGNDRVQVFDDQRHFVCVLNSNNLESGKLSMPHDVACLLDGRFVVVDKSSYAKIYDPNGIFLDRFSTLTESDTRLSAVELSCVTVDRRSRILIGDCKRNLITVHYVDGKIIKTIPAVGPEHIATTSKDLLVVSCPRKQKVRVMNHEGRFLFQMETFGAGEKLKPRGVACDDEDNIYVVHKERGGEKSVHVFNNHGKYLACVAKNLREPYDVDIAPKGRVIISDDDTLKIFTKKDQK